MDAALSALKWHLDDYGRRSEKRRVVDDRMEDLQRNALNKLEGVVNREFAQDFGKILAFAFFQGCPEAEALAKELNLKGMDFYAIEENFSVIEEDIQNEAEENGYFE